MSQCPSPIDLQSLLGGTLPDPYAESIREHVRACVDCQSWLETACDDSQFSPLARRVSEGNPIVDYPELGPFLDKMRAQSERVINHAASTTPWEHALPTILGPPRHEHDLGEFEGYRILSELGQGGMAFVLLGFDERLQRQVAIKILRPDEADDRSRSRFAREVKAAASVVHDHVVGIHGVSEAAGGLPYCVFDYMSGGNLAERIRSRGKLEPRDTAMITMQVATGLSAAHRLGLVHRDVKPSNILFDGQTGRAKIADFGLARGESPKDDAFRTQVGVVSGTPAYMSPEQVRGAADVGMASDVYSLGVTLYEELTGEVPFRGTTLSVLRQIEHDDPRPPRELNDRVPVDLQTICLKCMEKEALRRYVSAGALADDLSRFLEGRPIAARPASRAERAVRWCQRNPLVASLAGIALVAVVAGITGATYFAILERKQAVVATQRRAAAEKALAALFKSSDALLRPADDEQLMTEESRPYFEARINEGLSLSEEILRAFQDDERSNRIRSEALIMQAKLLVANGQRNLGLQKARDALTIFGRLNAANPPNSDNRAGMAIILHQLAALSPDRESQLSVAKRSNNIFMELIRSGIDPEKSAEWHRYVVLNLHNIGHQLFEGGKIAEAIEAFNEGKRLCDEQLRSGEVDENLPFRLAHIERYLCRANRAIALRTDDPTKKAVLLKEALDLGLQAVTHFRTVAARRPDQFGRAHDLYVTEREIGQFHFDTASWKEAVTQFGCARTTLIAMDARFGNLVSRRVSIQKKLAIIDYNILNSLTDPVQNDQQIRELADEAFRICDGLERLRLPLSDELKQTLAYACFVKADFRIQDSLRPDLELWHRTEHLWSELLQKQPQNYTFRYYLALTRLELADAFTAEGRAEVGLDKQKEALVTIGRQPPILIELMSCYSTSASYVGKVPTKLDSFGQQLLRQRLVGRGVWCLRQAIAGGFRDAERLRTDPAFAPLRVDADFRNAMNDLEFPENPFSRSDR
jgi:hypothetical protein